MKKLFVSFFALAVVCAMAMSVMAAPGDIFKIDKAEEGLGEYTFVGKTMPEFVIFKQANNYIAIWTPTSDHKNADYYYDLAAKATGDGSLKGFGGLVEFFWGSNASTKNNGSNIGTYKVVEGDDGWYAYSSVKDGSVKISNVFYCEGEEKSVKYVHDFWGAIHLTTDGVGTTTVTAAGDTSHTFKQGWGFTYFEVSGLSTAEDQVYDIIGNKGVKYGEAIFSLEDNLDIVITITGITIADGSEAVKIQFTRTKDELLNVVHS